MVHDSVAVTVRCPTARALRIWVFGGMGIGTGIEMVVDLVTVAVDGGTAWLLRPRYRAFGDAGASVVPVDDAIAVRIRGTTVLLRIWVRGTLDVGTRVVHVHDAIAV
jgi:hypothetical protein